LNVAALTPVIALNIYGTGDSHHELLELSMAVGPPLLTSRNVIKVVHAPNLEG
jgi:hypothetical protein